MILFFMTMPPKERNHSLDTLRVIAIIMVIGIHASGQYVLDDADVTGLQYYSAALYESLVQIGVPIFVMLSGAFMIGRKLDSWQAFYSKQLPKLLIPFMFWLPVNWLWIYVKGDSLYNLFMGGGGLMQLWFIPMLLFLYILTPPVNLLVERIEESENNRRNMLLLIAFLFIAGFGDDLYSTFSVNPPYQYYPYFSLRYLGYYLAGYFMRTHPIKGARHRVVLSGVYVIATLCILLFANILPTTETNQYFYHNLSPFIIISACSLFAMMANCRRTKEKENILSRQHKYVMGIYLIHIIWLNIVTKVFLVFMPEFMNLPLLSIPVRVFLVFIFSLISVRIMEKIPFLNKTLML